MSLVVFLVIASAALSGGANSAPKCEQLPQPKKWPATGALVDSAALAKVLQAVAGDGATGELIITVRFSSNPNARPVDVLVATKEQYSMVSAVVAGLKPVFKDAPEHFRLRVGYGKEVSIVAERSVLCAPVSEAGTPPGTIAVVGKVVSSGGASSPAGMSAGSGTRVSVRVLVSKDGTVTDVQMLASSGMGDIDRALKQNYMNGRYRPATLDGVPVDVWLNGTRVELAQ